MTNYEMTTISSGTRIRKEHNTFSTSIGSVGANVTVTGDELWTAPADGVEVKAGDKWLRLTSPQVGWMAYTHKGVPICKDFKEIGTPPPPPVPDLVSPWLARVHINSLGISTVEVYTISGVDAHPYPVIHINGNVIWNADGQIIAG